MTDREKLIKLLQKNATCIELGMKSCDYCQYGRVEDCYTYALVDHLLANGVTFQKWIPVTERLPEELENVLAYTDVGSFAETAHWTGHRWEKTWDFEVLYGVTHWMPLPEPPKEE